MHIFFNVSSPTTPPTVPSPEPTAPPPGVAIVIREAGLHDLPQSAQLHLDELPIGLFPELGARFLRRWHRSFVDRRHAIALVATDNDGAVVGFLLGTLDHHAHIGDLLRERMTVLSFAAHAGAAMAVRPRTAVRFVRTRLRPWCRAVMRSRPIPLSNCEPETLPADSVAVVVAIAVSPQVRGIGVGAQLLDWFESDSARAGARCAELSTDLGVADNAGGFYERLGWQKSGNRLDRDGRTMQTYRRELERRYGHAPLPVSVSPTRTTASTAPPTETRR
jgi:GNAT superfamily N-acetyltransferase